MDARTQRTLLRLFALFLALGGGDALVQYLINTPPSYDYRHLAGALLAAAIAAFEKYYSESNPDIASPTVNAVDVTLQTALDNPLVKVTPPTAQVPKQPTIQSADVAE